MRVLREIISVIKSVFRRPNLEEYYKILESIPHYEQIILSAARKGNLNAMQLLFPFVPLSEGEAYILACRLNQKLQQESRESKRNKEISEIHESLLGKPLQSEAERKKLQTIPPKIASEIRRIVEHISGEAYPEFEKTFVEHLRSYQYKPN